MLDISQTARVPISRLIKVEMRKMVDTRAGLWLLIVIGLITALFTVIFFFAAPDNERTFVNYMGVMATPQGFLLPVMGILLITQEWGQRTGMVTFTLEPHRGKVMGAKVLAALAFGMLAVLLALVLAALGAVVSGAPGAWENFGLDDVAKYSLLQVQVCCRASRSASSSSTAPPRSSPTSWCRSPSPC